MARLSICMFFVEVIVILLISSRFFNDTRRKCRLQICLITHCCLDPVLGRLFEVSLKRR